jgi:hypothetical protein
MICYFCGKEDELNQFEMIEGHLWCGCDDGEDWITREAENDLCDFDGEILPRGRDIFDRADELYNQIKHE